MNMAQTSFLVIETKNGSAFPRSVWEASSEADYINRVLANAQRCDAGETDQITTAAQAAAFHAERSAMWVEFMTEAQFNEYDPESLSQKVLSMAERLGWYQPQELAA